MKFLKLFSGSNLITTEGIPGGASKCFMFRGRGGGDGGRPGREEEEEEQEEEEQEEGQEKGGVTRW